MPNCGHKQRYVVSSDEGTNYCMECAYEGEIQRNNQLHADLADSSAQLVLDEVETQLLRSELEKARKRVESARVLLETVRANHDWTAKRNAWLEEET
jgi:stress response protein SCP2